LDIRYQHEVLSLVRHLGGTIVVVLHDLNLAARYCDRLVLLDRGAVAGAGTPDEVLQPDLIRRVYGIDARRVDVDGTPNLLFAPLRQEAA
jgi:iron complex transport system ATP-binding protein